MGDGLFRSSNPLRVEVVPCGRMRGDDLDGRMRMGVALGLGAEREVGGLRERLDQETPKKNELHKMNFVLRSDNSSVNAVPWAANRISRLQHDIQSNS
jgi:hypothetical protein